MRARRRTYVAQDVGGWYVLRIDPAVYEGTAYTLSGPWGNRATTRDIMREIEAQEARQNEVPPDPSVPYDGCHCGDPYCGGCEAAKGEGEHEAQEG